MDSTDIEYFLQVATHLNFTKAADVLFVSQSAISKKIQSLEKELGVVLFIRNSKNVVLTENGRRFKRYFERIKNEFSKELNLAHIQEKRESRTIKIGLISEWNIIKYVTHFSECSFEDYKIEYDKINSLLKRMVRHEFDIIIGSRKGIKQAIEQEGIENVKIEKLIDIKRIIYYSHNHPLAQKKNLKLIDFKDDILYTGKSKVAKENVIEICSNEGFMPKREPISNIETIMLKLLQGTGYAMGNEFSRIRSDRNFDHFIINHCDEVAVAYMQLELEDNKKRYINEIINVFINNSKME